MFKTLLKSKLVWGSIIGAGSWLLNQPHIQITEVLTAIGAVVSAVGARDAIRKSASPDSPEGQKAINDQLPPVDGRI